jgi:hypothetical protein
VHPLQQLTKEACRGGFVPPLLHEDSYHFSVLVDGAPRIVTLSPDCDKRLVKTPGVTESPLAMPELPRELATKL